MMKKGKTEAKADSKEAPEKIGAREDGQKQPAVPEGGEAGKAQGQNDMASLLKELESAMFSVRFYPVAVNEQAKNDALAKIEKTYAEGSETVRQMIIYMVHDALSASVDLKLMHTLEYFKQKSPANDSAQNRMSVYRAIFNYNTSLEGLLEFIRLLGRLRGSDDASKLLTYHYSHLCAQENSAHHMLRASIIESLGRSESVYAFCALLDYARYEDNEQTFQRVVSALGEWDKRIDTLKVPDAEKAHLRAKLQEVAARRVGGESHYR